MTAMIWIISGPSSAGKSTFFKNPRCREITGLNGNTPMIIPSRKSNLQSQDLNGSFFHYNICRPAVTALGKKTSEILRATPEKLQASYQFDTDPKWLDFLKSAGPKKAIVLVADLATIRDRVSRRRKVEPLLNLGKVVTYDAAYWQTFYKKLDLPQIYQAWCAELERRRIPYVLVDANDARYRLMPANFTFNESLPNGSGHGHFHTKKDIEKILSEEKFAYHRVNLPYGLHTAGQDRSATRDLALPDSLAGESVLDVGCALGYFCFEAEIRGASRVLGVELDDERFRQALILKNILGSNVEFLQQEIISNPLRETFDHVLLLNVIHHLPEPIRMIRHLAALARKRLVIEYPTFADKRFRRNAGIRFPRHYDRLPLIGVSSLAPGTDQTFVFTSGAIQRILQDHERLFKTVKIVDSPMKGRQIALCEK
jgi:2-polyprenyl-3-methyl-5-hydroxy-6-metoxy-1,4-benzoquinol methylase